jgi:general secretion pathway protein D
MKTRRLLISLALMLSTIVSAMGQTSPTERRALREYTSPEELVSIAPTATMDKALAAISEVSKKFTGKVIIDVERRTMPVNVDIQGMQWRDALEMILRKNDMWYTEYEDYIQINSVGSGTAAREGGGATTPVNPDIQRELATFRSREIKISAVFFEVSLSRLEEVGVNWNFMKSTKDVTINSEFTAADRLTGTIFKTEVTPKISFANITALANIFSNYDMGEILAGPQLIVRSGEEGRIQVGQDFSIKERDFAGNIIDKFYSAGTIIRVRPQVVTEKGVNFIHLIVDVERSNVVPGALSTIINKTKANTNLLLLDNEETVIGGLYSNEVSTVRVGIPFLKDLPWYVFGLKYLFGYDRDEVKKKELIILMKAELVPTLQERITQKGKADGAFERFKEQSTSLEQRMKTSQDQE